MNLLQALDDDQLFKPLFAGPTWRPWKAFLAALFALPLLYRAHTGRQAPPEAPFREAALVIGRRGGKSRILALVAVYLATFRDYTPHLAGGEVVTISVIASDSRQARVIFRFISGMLDATPMLRAMVTDESAEAISLSNRVVIEIHTCSFRATRGYSYSAVLCDEIAFWRDETSPNPTPKSFAHCGLGWHRSAVRCC
jgi:phage terminase large subunit-like protein